MIRTAERWLFSHSGWLRKVISGLGSGTTVACVPGSNSANGTLFGDNFHAQALFRVFG